MSVIAKMYVQSIRSFGDGRLVKLSCVYDNNLASSAYENVRFTKATPWGEASLTLHTSIPFEEQEQLYLYFSEYEKDVVPQFKEAVAALNVRCSCILDYGTSKQIEIVNSYHTSTSIPENLRFGVKTAFNLRMSIDNPAASSQMVPQKEYWMSVYRTDKSLDEVLVTVRCNARY